MLITKVKRKYKVWIYTIIGIALIAYSLTFILYLTRTGPISPVQQINPGIFASYGAFLGGILGPLFSVVTIIMLIKTLKSQKKAIKYQQKNFDRQLFETKFFSLLQIHRENRSQINIRDRQGGKILLSMQRELGNCLEALTNVSTSTTGPEFKISEEDKINISYLCFFYGAVGSLSTEILKDKLKKHAAYHGSIFDSFIDYQKSIQQKRGFDYKPFEGHQSRLGHYFRHLFQTIKYVDN